MKQVINDPHSFARPNEARVTHIDLDLAVSFNDRAITGKASLDFEAFHGAGELILDVKDLVINGIFDEQGRPVPYKLMPPIQHLGSALHIDISSGIKKVEIDYHTSRNAEALQWLDPVQTAGKKMPFLFTQSQAILARSWIPLQDSPGNRFTYVATIRVPVGMLALMSAENPQAKHKDGVYSFNMEQPIPAYLMSLAVGDLSFAKIGERTGVYAEPAMLEQAKYEFGEMENMLKIAEDLYGKYRWGRYDLIVLPPSFPFGGMENPRITFATPTILAGDRSLTSLVAHELAHSWSGNLVTNATWNDFWLNEGFTVYFEYRIMEALHGRSYSEMLAALSQQDLKKEVRQFQKEGKSRDTRLKLDLSGRNPDEGVSTIAYDKGYFFLRYLEGLTGREKFDVFLKGYFRKYAFQSSNTESFLSYLQEHLFKANGLELPDTVQEWIYGEGLPESMPLAVSDRFQQVDATRETWENGASPDSLETTNWSTHEWLHFIRHLPGDLSLEQMAQLDEAFGFTQSGNAEILAAWFVHVIRHQFEQGYEALENFLVHTGRRKFLVPLYSELVKTSEGKLFALNIYQKARPNYHFVSTHTMDSLLDWNA